MQSEARAFRPSETIRQRPSDAAFGFEIKNEVIGLSDCRSERIAQMEQRYERGLDIWTARPLDGLALAEQASNMTAYFDRGGVPEGTVAIPAGNAGLAWKTFLANLEPKRRRARSHKEIV